MFLQRMVRHLAAFALFAFLATPSMASAQDVPSDTPQDALPSDTPQDALPTPQDAADSGTTDETIIRGHGFQLGMSFLGVPGYFFNPWFAKHGSTWDGVVNMGVSLDYFLRFQVPCELRFTLSWFNARTGSTYWLDDDHKNAPHLAHYIVNQLSSVNIEIAAYHIVPIIDEISFYTAAVSGAASCWATSKVTPYALPVRSVEATSTHAPTNPAACPPPDCPPSSGSSWSPSGSNSPSWNG